MPERKEAVERRFGALDIGELNSLSALLGQQWEGHGAHHLYAEVEAERKLRYDAGDLRPIALRSQIEREIGEQIEGLERFEPSNDGRMKRAHESGRLISRAETLAALTTAAHEGESNA